MHNKADSVFVFFSLEVKSFLLSFASFHSISEILISSGLMGVVRVLYIFSKEIKFAIIPSVLSTRKPRVWGSLQIPAAISISSR